MKKKFRTITVDDEAYTWLVARIDADYVCVKVWRPPTLSAPWLLVRLRLDDVWLKLPDVSTISELATQPITPALVASIIRSAQAKNAANTSHYKFDSGTLTPVENALAAQDD